MKKIILAITIMYAHHAGAQWVTSGSDAVTALGINNVYALNKLAIGLPASTPLSDYLSVNNNISLLPQFPTSITAIRGNNNNNSFNIYCNTNTIDGPYISLSGLGSTLGNITLNAMSGFVGASGNPFEFNISTTTGSYSPLVIDAAGSLSLDPTRTTIGKFVYANCTTPFSNICYAAGVSTSPGSYIRLWGGGGIQFNSESPTILPPFQFLISGSPYMTMSPTGQLIIGDAINSSTTCGTTSSNVPGTYKLYVQDGILTEMLKVANRCDGLNWSDFVFNKDYKLMPLQEVASYVSENKHLPSIPSASEVAKDGIDVADMDARLLQKIEELTLYVIAQQKEIDELKKQAKQ